MTTGKVTKTRSAAIIDGIKSSTWGSRIAVPLTALLLVLLLVRAVQEPALFTSQLLIGLTNGAILALVALGYTLVYGIIELINFAHGDNFMIGSFVGLTVLSGTIVGLELFAPITINSGAPLRILGVLIALFVAMVACGLLNVGIERVAYKPLRNAPRLAVLITAIGMSFILQNVGLVWKGPIQVPFPELISSANILPSDTIIFRWKDLFVILVTVPLLVALSYFIGITIFNVGFTQGLYAFTAAVLGGIGNLTGAVVGGLLIGVISAMSDQYIGTTWTPIVIFSVLILVLVFRPRGLLGDRSAVQGGGE